MPAENRSRQPAPIEALILDMDGFWSTARQCRGRHCGSSSAVMATRCCRARSKGRWDDVSRRWPLWQRVRPARSARRIGGRFDAARLRGSAGNVMAMPGAFALPVGPPPRACRVP